MRCADLQASRSGYSRGSNSDGKSTHPGGHPEIHHILQLQEKKRALAKAALEGGHLAKGNKLEMRELIDLFTRRDHDDERDIGHRN